MKAVPLVLLGVVCWFASCAGLQWLAPQSIWETWLGWQFSQWLYPGLQCLTLWIGWRHLRRGPISSLWLALLAWWAFPWQGEAQWLRCLPSQVLWHLALVGWLWVPGKALWILLASWLEPASLAPLALAQASLPAQGRKRSAWLVLALLSLPLDLRPADAEAAGWLLLSALVGLGPAAREKSAHWSSLALFTFVSACKGGPTSSLILIPAVLWLNQRFLDRSRGKMGLTWLWGVALTLLLGLKGESQLNRHLLVPWQQAGISFVEGFLPHDRWWWAEQIGPSQGFTSADLKVCQWIEKHPGKALVITPALGLGEDPWMARIYRRLTGGQAGWGWDSENRWSLAATQIKWHRRLTGSGLDWLVVRGAEETQGAVFQTGNRALWANPGGEVRHQVETLEVWPDSSRWSPGGRVEFRASGADLPLSESGTHCPRLVLFPDLARLQLPLFLTSQSYQFDQQSLNVPPLDVLQQLAQLNIELPPTAKARTQGSCLLSLYLSNPGPNPVHLEALEGMQLRLDLPGAAWQPPWPLAKTLGPGERLQIQVPLATSCPSGVWRLRAAWCVPGLGRLEVNHSQLWLTTWIARTPEVYFDISPSSSRATASRKE